MNLKNIYKPFILLTLLMLAVFYFSLCIGELSFNPVEVFRMLFLNGGENLSRDILLLIRLPRLLTAVLVGAALAAAGSIFQTIIQNPLGDPYIIGVSSGAALGMVLMATFGIGGELLGLPVAAILGGMTAVLTVFILAKRGGKVRTTRLILAGIVVSAYFSALTMFLLSQAKSTTVQGITFWMMGDLGYQTLDKLIYYFPLILFVIIIQFLLSGKVNILILGDDTAKQLGINVERMKIISILIASFLTGMAVAIAGVIGFIGLVVPNFVRSVWGSDFRLNFTFSVLCGGILVLLADLAVRIITPVSQVPVGIVTALIGAPFFINLLLKAKD
ncbi:MAG: iron ABC transporter permease [Acidobacteria bacterium]|nr:iron ABC transporter permease [Acidobacteriota bacterium]